MSARSEKRGTSWTATYESFWPAFRAAHAVLPTSSAYMRKPDDIWANYVGCRSTVFGNAYAEIRFRGAGVRRSLIVAIYCAQRDHPDWHVMRDRIRGATAALGPLEGEKTGAGAERLYFVVAPELTPRAVATRQVELIAAAAGAYSVLFDAMERQQARKSASDRSAPGG